MQLDVTLLHKNCTNIRAIVQFFYRSTKDIGPVTLRLTYTNPENHKTAMIEGKI